MPKYKTAQPHAPISLEDVERYASMDVEPWVKALVFTLWAWGVRIVEVVGRKEQVIKGRVYPEFPPKIKRDLRIEDGYLWLNVPPAKNKKDELRNLPIKLDTPHIDLLLSYLNTLEETAVIFPYSSEWCWVQLKKLDPTLCAHRFRHNRATKIALTRAHPYELQNWLGHSDMRMSNNYIHGSGVFAEELGKKMDIR
jgi:integrase